MKINESIFLYGSPSNYNPEATGNKKVFITPQVSYSKGKFSIYASADFPVYQYLNTSRFYTQVGSQHQVTTGISYRFFATDSPLKNLKSTNTYLKGTNTYYCPMHKEVTSDKPGKCPTCGMALEKTK